MSQMMQQGPPPGLMALLQGQGAGTPGAAETPENPSDDREALAILKQMIQLASRYIQVEPDAADKATMAKVQATLHQYLAREQSDAEQALGGGPATRLMRKLGGA